MKLRFFSARSAFSAVRTKDLPLGHHDTKDYFADIDKMLRVHPNKIPGRNFSG
jgi:hypothetical protein